MADPSINKFMAQYPTKVLLFQDSFQMLNHSICYKCQGIPPPNSLHSYNIDENLLKVMINTHNTNQAIDQLSEVTSLRLFYRSDLEKESKDTSLLRHYSIILQDMKHIHHCFLNSFL